MNGERAKPDELGEPRSDPDPPPGGTADATQDGAAQVEAEILLPTLLRDRLHPHVALLIFAACAVVLLFGFQAVARSARTLGPGHGDRVGAVLAGALLLLVPGLIASFVLPRVPHRTLTLLIVFAIGGAVRIDFLPLEPTLSDDVYRYIWDGRVQAAGLNPYGIAPVDAALDAVEAHLPATERVRDRVNHPEIATVYPPGLEVLFAVVGKLDGDLALWKRLLLLGEVLLASLLVRGLTELGRDPRLVLLYLWHPLPVFEVAWNAHAELFAVLPFVWCALLLTERKRLLGGLAFGAAVAAKILPVGFAVTLLRRGGPWAALGAVMAIAWLVSPYASSTDVERASAGLREYAGSWYFNDLLYRPLGTWLGLDPENRFATGAQWLRGALGAVWVLVAIATSKRTPVAAALALTVAFVLLTPTVHPWYLLWVLPFAVLLESRAWWLLAGTTLIAYEVVAGHHAAGVWEPRPTRALVYAAPLVWAGWSVLRERWEDRRIARGLAG